MTAANLRRLTRIERARAPALLMSAVILRGRDRGEIERQRALIPADNRAPVLCITIGAA